MTNNVAISVTNLTKTYKSKVLNSISFDIQEGDFTALIGPSGSGKSTLMRHLSGLVTADKANDAAKIHIDGNLIQANGKLAKNIRTQRQHIGCIFQQFNLVNRLSVLNNVLIGFLGSIPSWRGYVGYFTTEEKQKALQALNRVGLAHIAAQKAGSLSGGQQQRVAIARALVQDAKVILADEPIASLDPKSAGQVMDMLKEINEQDGKTVIVTLHQVGVARKYCEKIIALREGQLYFQGHRDELTDEKLKQLYGGDVSEMLDAEDNMQRSETKNTEIAEKESFSIQLMEKSRKENAHTNKTVPENVSKKALNKTEQV